MTLIVRLFLCFLIFNSYSIYASESLRFIGDVNFTTGEKFQNTEIGGLSGIVYDPLTKKLLAISDDKSYVNEARFYEFDLKLTQNIFSVKPSKVVKLKTQDGTYFKKGVADFEGITFFGNDILVSNEGAINRVTPTPPELYRFTREGAFKALLTIPEKFLLPKKEQIDKLYGSRDNKSFESLSTSLDGKTTFMASEESLFQDGGISTISYSSRVRIILYKDLKPVTEVAYELEKVEALKGDLSNAENGLVDIAAIDDKNFYTLERSWLPFINKNVIRIFKCKITDKTTDISKLDSLKGATFMTVQKELVADLDNYITKMNPASLDNIEGMALGPVLDNGKRSLIVVSDNNFGKDQRTVFIAFEIR